MCGIGGFFLKKANGWSVPEVLSRFNSALAHRGPDDEGYALWDENWNLTLAGGNNTDEEWFKLPGSRRLLRELPDQHWSGGMLHRRLSILDLSVSGHQPYPLDEQSALTYNGEIYNFRSLLPSFQANSATDTEVLAAFLSINGLNRLDELDGMFAFGWLDVKNEVLTLVRDRMGVKPLYYINTSAFFAFSSEPFPLHSLLKINPTPSYSLISDYLIRGIVEHNGSGFWEPVEELKPGELLSYELKTGVVSKHHWFNADSVEKKPPTIARRELEDSLQKSVLLRLQSDVPIGCSLSGGLDSGIITAISRLLKPNEPLKAFTATWPGHPESEAELARMVAVKTGAEWIEVPLLTSNLEHYWSEITRFQGYPLIHTSTLAQGKVMQAAANQGIKVMLDGQGGDELFGGYRHHALMQNQSLVYLIKALMESLISKLYPSFRLAFHPMGKCWKGRLPEGLPIATYRTSSSLRSLLIEESYGEGLKNLLRWADRSGMAYGIESRFPLADSPDLQSVAFSLADSDAISEEWTKLALRKLASEYLPKEIVWNRIKSAYGSPQTAWIAESWKNWLSELHPSIHEFLDVEKLKSIVPIAVKSGRTDWVFRIKALSEWMKVYYH